MENYGWTFHIYILLLIELAAVTLCGKKSLGLLERTQEEQ